MLRAEFSEISFVLTCHFRLSLPLVRLTIRLTVRLFRLTLPLFRHTGPIDRPAVWSIPLPIKAMDKKFETPRNSLAHHDPFSKPLGFANPDW